MDFFDILKSIADWLQLGIYSWFEEAMIYVVAQLTIFWIHMQLWGLNFAWGVAQDILSAFNVQSYINQAYGQLSGQVYSMVVFFKIPEAVNLIVSALATRFVLNLIPGL